MHVDHAVPISPAVKFSRQAKASTKKVDVRNRTAVSVGIVVLRVPQSDVDRRRRAQVFRLVYGEV